MCASLGCWDVVVQAEDVVRDMGAMFPSHVLPPHMGGTSAVYGTAAMHGGGGGGGGAWRGAGRGRLLKRGGGIAGVDRGLDRRHSGAAGLIDEG